MTSGSRPSTFLEGTQGLKLHQLCRAMDFVLEANKEAIEQAIFHQVADLLDLDVEVIFYDTTSLHFEIDDEDSGDQNGNVREQSGSRQEILRSSSARAQQEQAAAKRRRS